MIAATGGADWVTYAGIATTMTSTGVATPVIASTIVAAVMAAVIATIVAAPVSETEREPRITPVRAVVSPRIVIAVAGRIDVER